MNQFKNCSMCGKQLNPDTTGEMQLELQEIKLYKIKLVYPCWRTEMYYLCSDCAENVKEMIRRGKSDHT